MILDFSIFSENHYSSGVVSHAPPNVEVAVSSPIGSAIYFTLIQEIS